MAAEQEPTDPRPFDVGTIKRLVGLMSRHDLTEIDLQEGDRRVRLRRARPNTLPAVAPLPPAAAAPVPATAPAGPPAEPRKPERPSHLIRSPTIGTFYVAREPGAPPFVKVGSRVAPTTVVCIIEAMKLLSDVTADCSGVITAVLVENGHPVEYNAPLFEVDPAG